DDHRRRHAGRGLMMLVHHDVVTELVGEHPFVVITVEEIGRDLGIAFAVRQVDAQRALMVLPGVRIGLLGELIDLHEWVLSRRFIDYHQLPAKARTWRANASGCSMCGKWPARSIGANRAPGIAAQ